MIKIMAGFTLLLVLVGLGLNKAKSTPLSKYKEYAPKALEVALIISIVILLIIVIAGVF